jgi:spore photoproduct lyase
MRFRNSKNKVRVGNGEFFDSLYYDDITEYSIKISKELGEFKNVYFEFKTKSINVDNFFKIKPSQNIVISYSLNPIEIIEKTEHRTPSFYERIECLKKLSEYGYYVGIHFDPVIKINGWEDFYYRCIKILFYNLDKKKIKWISIGSFRFAPETKKIIEKRFPDNIILDEEMVIDFDGKLRYPFFVRKNLYKKIIEFIISFGYPKEKIYLCMEEKRIWDEVSLKYQFRWED